MPPKLLVANRGEIACRIMRSARALGLGVVAVHSAADAAALHVAMADDAVDIGPSPPRDSYLVIDKIIEAAKTTGATLVHPGYGFLAENADFARAVDGAGLVFVGPTPETIDALGDKVRARAAASSAGVPILPGSPPFSPGAGDGIAEAAAAVGYPLLVKAAAGGGGIGMRRVDGPEGLALAVTSTQELAVRAFGDGTVYLERYVARARHVEIQVFGLGDGRAIHLFERDCSIQRRFQKVVEESPAPGLSAGVRERMYRASVSLAAAVRYRGAGTLEFVLDPENEEFFFLEMNTRIQVEHPVTEMVTGLDLVACQLKLALGELDPGELSAAASQGHAIECRIYAEDPSRNFLPSPGRLTTLRLPESSAQVRVDTGVREGDTVTPFYDPMLAKVICRGATRDAAREVALTALAEIRIEGVRSNVAYLRAVLAHPSYRAGDLHTGFLDEHASALKAGLAPATAGTKVFA